MSYPKIELTDTEWMGLIDGSPESERPGTLYICCPNVSALRDSIMQMARNGGEVNPFYERQLRQALGWVLDSHHDVVEIPALGKIAAALGVEFETVTHEARRIEL